MMCARLAWPRRGALPTCNSVSRLHAAAGCLRATRLPATRSHVARLQSTRVQSSGPREVLVGAALPVAPACPQDPAPPQHQLLSVRSCGARGNRHQCSPRGAARQRPRMGRAFFRELVSNVPGKATRGEPKASRVAGASRRTMVAPALAARGLRRPEGSSNIEGSGPCSWRTAPRFIVFAAARDPCQRWRVAPHRECTTSEPNRRSSIRMQRVAATALTPRLQGA